MYPWEAADFLENIAKLSGTTSKFKRYKSNDFGSKIADEDEQSYTINSLFGTKGKARELFDQLSNIVKEVTNNNLNIKATKHYASFKKDETHNVVAVWPKNGWVEVVLNAKLGSIKDDTGTIYDISNRKWTAAQYAFRFDSSTDIEIVKKLIEDTYKL